MDENLRENVKIDMKKVDQEFKKIELRHDHFLTEKGIPDVKELIDFSSKGLNWLFAIIVGTLLWGLNKFEIINALSMPYKNLYVVSIICIGLSSILLVCVLGKLYWLNYKAIKALVDYNNYLKTYNRHFVELKIKRDKINEMIEIAPLPELKMEMNEFVANFSNFVKRMDISTNLLEAYLVQFSNMHKILGNTPTILGSLIAYFLGLILMTVYIILLLYK